MTNHLDLDAMERRANAWVHAHRHRSPSLPPCILVAPHELIALIARVRELEAVHDAGLSWSGFNLHGDRKSIDEAKRLIHRDGRCADLESIVRELKQCVSADAQRIDDIKALVDSSVAAERKRCSEIARRDVDWTRFNKREIEQWDSGADGVRDYRLGVKVGEMIALAIEREGS